MPSGEPQAGATRLDFSVYEELDQPTVSPIEQGEIDAASAQAQSCGVSYERRQFWMRVTAENPVP